MEETKNLNEKTKVQYDKFGKRSMYNFITVIVLASVQMVVGFIGNGWGTNMLGPVISMTMAIYALTATHYIQQLKRKNEELEKSIEELKKKAE